MILRITVLIVDRRRGARRMRQTPDSERLTTVENGELTRVQHRMP